MNSKASIQTESKVLISFTKDVKIEGSITYIPFYMTMFLKMKS